MARYRDKSKVYLTINIYSQSLTEDCLGYISSVNI